MKRINHTFWQFVSLTIVFLGLVTGLILVPMVQDIREEASVIQGKATVSIEPPTGSFSLGDSFTANILFNTSNTAISGIAVRLSYPFSGTVPGVRMVSVDINPTILSSGDWVCPTKNSNLELGMVIIDIACANTTVNGYVSNGDKLFAKLNFQVDSIPSDGKLTLRFDPVQSVITEKATNLDILITPTNYAEYVIGQFSGPVLYFVPSQINVITNSTDQNYDIYLDTRGYEVNGAVFEIKFDPNLIRIKDVLEGDILRLVVDKSVEGGTAYLSVVLADETKPFIGNGKAASVLFDTFSTTTTTYFTFEPNTQIHTKGLTSNILDKAIKGTIHIGATPTIGVPTLTPTIIPTSVQSPFPTTCLLLGDSNGDCKVDGLDYSVWLLHFGQFTDNGPADGDFNGDDFVDGVDYAIWFLNFGK